MKEKRYVTAVVLKESIYNYINAMSELQNINMGKIISILIEKEHYSLLKNDGQSELYRMLLKKIKEGNSLIGKENIEQISC